MHGGNTSQVIKDVLTDLHKLKGVRLFCVCSVFRRRRLRRRLAVATTPFSPNPNTNTQKNRPSRRR